MQIASFEGIFYYRSHALSLTKNSAQVVYNDDNNYVIQAMMPL